MNLISFVILCFLTCLANGRYFHSKRDVIAESKYRELRDDSVDSLENTTFWMNHGRQELFRAMDKIVPNTRIAKNVLIFIGDGMSIPTLTAGRIYKAQQLNNDFSRPESSHLTFERFDHVGLSKTYAIDNQIPDSASTASAMFSGIKTKYYTVGYDSSIDHYDITSMQTATEVETILSWAQKAQKDTGFVTTARLTHATPAALYAHCYDRDLEANSDYVDGGGVLPPYAHDIAYQFVWNDGPATNAKVVLGGGGGKFCTKGNPSYSDWECERTDSNELLDDWQEIHGSDAKIVKSVGELNAIDVSETDYLLGIFGDSHMEYEDKRNSQVDPSLSEMTQKALEMLFKEDNGFFLMVEGARIDHGHHLVKATRALSETVALDQAVEKALEMLENTNRLDETLIIVTADHSHTMSINGYSLRGNDIRGLSTSVYDDQLPYTTMSYGNGKAYYFHNIANANGTGATRLDLSTIPENEVKDFEFEQTSTGVRELETHGGDDVAIFARGPMSHLFHTSHDQPYIAHVMAYAACMGPYTDEPRCTEYGKNGVKELSSNLLNLKITLIFVFVKFLFIW